MRFRASFEKGVLKSTEAYHTNQVNRGNAKRYIVYLLIQDHGSNTLHLTERGRLCERSFLGKADVLRILHSKVNVFF